MSDFIAGAVMTVALALLSWGVVFSAGTALWRAAIGVHRLIAGM